MARGSAASILLQTARAVHFVELGQKASGYVMVRRQLAAPGAGCAAMEREDVYGTTNWSSSGQRCPNRCYKRGKRRQSGMLWNERWLNRAFGQKNTGCPCFF